MSVTFGGLATGLDTGAIIEALMKVERKPLDRLQNEKNYLSTRLKAFADFDKKLNSLLEKAEGLDTSKEFLANKAELSSEDFFDASADPGAPSGVYSVEVVSLAKVEKEVSSGYADIAAQDFGTGTLTLDVGGNAVDITIDGTNNSLGGIKDAINAADAGVTASIINDGDAANPYRLVLTADDAATSVSLTSSLSGGTHNDLPLTETQTGTKAHIRVDGIDIYRDSNTVTEAIPGITLDLARENVAGETTTMTVDTDRDAVKDKIQEFVDAYNGMINFIADQSDADWGNDAGLKSPQRKLQNILVSAVKGSGSFGILSEIGIETQKDGTLQVSSVALEDAIKNDLESVEKLIVGEPGIEGVATKFKNYLESATDSTDGVYAIRKESTESNQKRLDSQIERQESRLDQREETLRSQFTAMEQMVSVMNSQSAFLSQQLASISLMGYRQ